MAVQIAYDCSRCFLFWIVSVLGAVYFITWRDGEIYPFSQTLIFKGMAIRTRQLAQHLNKISQTTNQHWIKLAFSWGELCQFSVNHSNEFCKICLTQGFFVFRLTSANHVAKYCVHYVFLSRRGGRAVECTGLENRQGWKPFEGSNPSSSAIFLFSTVQQFTPASF